MRTPSDSHTPPAVHSSIWDVLSGHEWLHRLLRVLRVYPLTGVLLHHAPIPRRLGGSRLRYRISSLDQLGLQAELFGQECYGPAIEGVAAPRTVIDLGANAGWFDVWLAHRTRSRAFRSLLIEADPRLVEEARWHVAVNRLAGCEVVHGAVGVASQEPMVSFFVSPSATQSSLQREHSDVRLPVKGRTQEIRVPTVTVAAEWTRAFGDLAVDLLKVDIEGAEVAFFALEGDFVARRVRRIVVEWDKAVSDSATFDGTLAGLGFSRTLTVKDDRRTGVAVFDRR